MCVFPTLDFSLYYILTSTWELLVHQHIMLGLECVHQLLVKENETCGNVANGVGGGGVPHFAKFQCLLSMA
jgi:hypothetical protein